MAVEIEQMCVADYDEAVALWAGTAGVVLRNADSREGIARFLARNPGLSFVARVDDRLAGTALCGHDGRRGYLYHMAVVSDLRRRGIGRMLAARCVRALEAEGIDRCHLFVVRSNEEGDAFWQRLGWSARPDVGLMTRLLEGEATQ